MRNDVVHHVECRTCSLPASGLQYFKTQCHIHIQWCNMRNDVVHHVVCRTCSLPASGLQYFQTRCHNDIHIQWCNMRNDVVNHAVCCTCCLPCGGLQYFKTHNGTTYIYNTTWQPQLEIQLQNYLRAFFWVFLAFSLLCCPILGIFIASIFPFPRCFVNFL